MNYSKIVRSTLFVSFSTLIIGMLNYTTLIILASRFGAKFEMDAFFSASTLPQIISSILLATLSTTFLPVFIEEKQKDETNAWKVASIAVNLVFLILLVMGLSGNILSRNIISLINPGFTAETARLSASLFRWLIMATVFSGSSILFSSLYYSFYRFIKPLTAQLVNSGFVLLFVILMSPKMGIKSVAVGTFIGSLIQFTWLAPILFKKGKYTLNFDFRKREILKLSRLMLPLLVGAVFYKTYALVERFIASRLGEGSISYLGYSNKIITAMLIVISQGLSTVLFPKMSELSAIKNYQQLRETMSRAVGVVITLSLPVATYIILFKHDIIRLIFERGNFSTQATEAIANVLVVSLGFFVAASLSLPIVNTLYSLQETTKVAGVGIFGFSLFILLAHLLSLRYSYLGIALAASIQYVISLSIFVFILAKKIGFEGLNLFKTTTKVIIISILSWLIVFQAKSWLKAATGFPGNFLLSSMVFCLVVLLLLIIFRVEETRLIVLKFFSKRTS